jgi:flagellar hook assembly protein FlgD
MGHGRLRWALVAGAVLVASLGLTATPAFAAPSTVPVFTSPAAGDVAGAVTVTVASGNTSLVPTVQFSLDGSAYGTPVAVAGGTASVQWPTWSLPDGPHSWTAVDCDGSDCNTTESTPLVLTVANTPPTITAPAGGAVSGDVTITATTAAPKVQFSLDGSAYGTPVTVNAGSASTSWPTWSLSDGPHSWTAAECDTLGCNPAQSAAVAVTTDNPPPTFTTPTDGATVSGDVTVSVMTAAPKVQFALDDVAFGSPVTVTGGAASVQWSTFGLPDGAHEWSATECDALGCNPASRIIDITIANTAPSVTAPVNGGTTGPEVTIDASAPGGGLEFFLDGSQVSFDGAAPYSFTPASRLSLGSHTASVKQCDVTGTTCNGASSSTVTFTVGKLSPAITSVSPSPFSPGDDGRNDHVRFRLHLPDPQRVTFRILNSNGQTVRGPHSSGLVGAGDHTLTWDGRNNAGKIVGDGSYTMAVVTSTGSGPTLLSGGDSAGVRVDHTPTAYRSITGKGATFFPMRDHYLDAFSPSVTVNEGGRLWLEITNARGARFRVIGKAHASAGTFRLAWNGRDSRNALVRSGRYRYRYRSEDRAGNISVSRSYPVYVSHRRTVQKTVTLVRLGDSGRVSTTNPHCTLYSLGFSNFDHGLWLNNGCDRGFDGRQLIYADYTFKVPGAVQYESIRARTKGETTHAPEPISTLVYDFTNSKWDAAGTVNLHANSRAVVSTFGRVSGAHRVSIHHTVRIRIAVPDQVTPQDYDVATTSIIVSYRRLK